MTPTSGKPDLRIELPTSGKPDLRIELPTSGKPDGGRGGISKNGPSPHRFSQF